VVKSKLPSKRCPSSSSRSGEAVTRRRTPRWPTSSSSGWSWRRPSCHRPPPRATGGSSTRIQRSRHPAPIRAPEIATPEPADVDLTYRTVLIAHNLVEGPSCSLVEKDTKTHAARRIALDTTTAEGRSALDHEEPVGIEGLLERGGTRAPSPRKPARMSSGAARAAGKTDSCPGFSFSAA